jgi:hypothetical protein
LSKSTASKSLKFFRNFEINKINKRSEHNWQAQLQHWNLLPDSVRAQYLNRVRHKQSPASHSSHQRAQQVLF